MNNIKNRKAWWDEKYSIARGWAKDSVKEEEAEYLEKKTIEMGEMHEPPIDWIVDLSEITSTTSKARKILAKLESHSSIGKYAMVGGSVFIRTVGKFISTASKHKNSRHFKTDAEALKWIQEPK